MQKGDWRCAANYVWQQPPNSDQAAGGGGGRHHTLELPHVNDHPKSLASYRCRMPSEMLPDPLFPFSVLGLIGYRAQDPFLANSPAARLNHSTKWDKSALTATGRYAALLHQEFATLCLGRHALCWLGTMQLCA